jgi:integrase
MATIVERTNDQGQVIGFQVKVRRRGYPSQSKTFDRKTDAERWARKIEREIDDGVFIDRKSAHQTTLADLIDRYITEVTPKHKGAKQEEQRLRQLRGYRIAQHAAATVSNQDFVEWRNDRSSQVAPGTVIRELNLWHSIIEHGRKEWGINLHENPVHLVKRPTPDKARERRLDPIPDSDGKTEEDRLLMAADSDKDRFMGAIVRLAIESAMRQGELLGLRWADIDLSKSIAVLHDTKNGERRVVPLSSRARKVLENIPRNITGMVFPIDQNAFKMRFRRCCTRAGIEDLRFHDLRHEATSRLFEKGLAMMEVASITGHKSLAMLKRYTHLHAPNLAQKLG